MYKEKLYSVWNAMKQRCSNENDKAFQNYGGRGIFVCDLWKNDYIAFKAWAESSGYRPGLWLDRKDNDGPYSPNNCRWAEPKTQQRNKRTNVMLSIGGVKKCISEWAEESGLSFATIKRRIELGWPEDHILDPVDHRYSHSELIKAAMEGI